MIGQNPEPDNEAQRGSSCYPSQLSAFNTQKPTGQTFLFESDFDEEASRNVQPDGYGAAYPSSPKIYSLQ